MRIRWWLAIVLIVIALLALAYLYGVSAIVHEGKLADGGILRFERAFTGTIHFDSYSPTKAAVTSNLSHQLQSRFGDRVQQTFVSRANEIGLVFSIWPKDKASSQIWYPALRVEFIESTGHCFKSYAPTTDASFNFFCKTVGSFPRRDPILQFRCYEENHDQPILELRVPNPGFEPSFVEWSPEDLPISKSQGPLTVTLKRGPQDSFVNYLRAEDIELSSADKSWTEIRPQWNAWMSDATGNRSRNLSELSPFEPAWKLTLKIHRDPSASFTEDEVWRTELFPVPADLSVTKLDLRHVAAGIELRAPFVSSAGSVEEIGGALSVTPSNDSNLGGPSIRMGRDPLAALRCIDSSRPFIPVIHAALDEATELILTVRDQTGRKISRENSTPFESNGVHTRILQFIPTEETKEVRLEAIVNRGLTFEFFVKPHKPDKVAQ